MTDTEANKTLVKRYFTALETGDLTALDEVVSTDYQDHAPGRQPGREALKAAAQTLRVAFPDMTSTVTHMLAEGDLIAVRNRVTGTQHGPLAEFPATGNRVDFAALQLFRVEDELIVEHWEIFDETTVTQQLSGCGPGRSRPRSTRSDTTSQLTTQERQAAAMDKRMKGKTALVTGATSNIGRAIATAFAAEGARVIVSGRSPERGTEVVEQIHAAGGHAEFIAADLDGSVHASQALAADATRALGGRIDVLVNNAGIFPGSTTPTVDEAMFDEVYAVNVKAPFFLTAAIAPEMNARGSGSIINLGSWVARMGIPVGALYASTKGAMETLTRAWAAEFGSPGVRINAISPGVVRTPIENDPAAAMMNGTPHGGFGTPEAIAHAAVYLASDESQFVNGTVIDVDGGRVGVAVIAS